MNEIEQMYKNAGVKRKKPACVECFLDRHSCNRTYDECPELYPPFTAEKQLEITKLIGLRYGLKFIINEGMDYMLSTDLYNTDKLDKQGYGYGFDEAIANLICNLWQDLTEDEKQKIREILE